jgi:hypothetical protein
VPSGRWITLSGVESDVLIVACGMSAGIHAALVPDHFAEGTGAGIGFAFAAVVLASCALATTTALPLLHPDVESVDALALATKAIEAGGLLAAAHLLWRGRSALAVIRVPPTGRLT